MQVSLTLTQEQLETLSDSLLLGDGLEAAAIVICGRCNYGDRHRLLAHRVVPVPLEAYTRRERNILSWQTSFLEPLLVEACKKGMGILKVHSHPGGYAAFSATDDHADATLFPSIFGWLDDGLPHASAILLPNYQLLGRAQLEDGSQAPLSSITVISDDIHITYPDGNQVEVSDAGERNAQVFGERTYSALRRLRAAVVGCSGTGGWVIELLAKLEIGDLVLVDDDRVEKKNLNRISGARAIDIGRFKVDVLRDHVTELGFGSRVEAIPHDLSHSQAWTAVAGADVVFGCVDSIDGRHLLNRLAAYYSLPYFDVGVRLIADGDGGIEQVCGTTHYVQPGRSSLLTRGLYTLEQVRAANLKRADPAAFEAERNEGYITGVAVGRPAVAPVNMFYAAALVLDFLARLHPFRLEPNSELASQMWSLSGLFDIRKTEGDYEPDIRLAQHVGRGDAKPPLDLPLLKAPSS